MKKVGPALKTAREAAGISQSALAKRVGISAAQLAQIENGQRADPYFSSVARIAGAMGLSLDALAALCGISGFGRSPRDAASQRTRAVRLGSELEQVQRDLRRASERVDAVVEELAGRDD